MNKAIQMGRLTRDPEVRHTRDGDPVVRFSIAVHRPGNKHTDNAIYLDIVCFGNTAEFAGKHLSKGRRVVVDGRIDTSDYTDRKGIKRRAWEIIADRLYFADSSGLRSAEEAVSAEKKEAQTEREDDPLPFGFETVPDDGAALPF